MLLQEYGSLSTKLVKKAVPNFKYISKPNLQLNTSSDKEKSKAPHSLKVYFLNASTISEAIPDKFSSEL